MTFFSGLKIYQHFLGFLFFNESVPEIKQEFKLMNSLFFQCFLTFLGSWRPFSTKKFGGTLASLKMMILVTAHIKTLIKTKKTIHSIFCGTPNTLAKEYEVYQGFRLDLVKVAR